MSQSKVLLLILSLVLTYCCVQADDSEESFSRWDDFPWLVYVSKTYARTMGAGALISNRAVLTASKIIRDLNGGHLKVVIYKRGWIDPERRSVSSVVHHPNFNLTTGAYNLALLFLNEPIDFIFQIAPINLATPTSISNLDLTSCIVKDSKKWQVSTAIFRLDDSLMCACGGTGKRPVGGYPLVCPLARDPSQFQLVGILSGNPHCNSFTNVVKAHGWINQQIGLYPYIEGPADEDYPVFV